MIVGTRHGTPPVEGTEITAPSTSTMSSESNERCQLDGFALRRESAYDATIYLAKGTALEARTVRAPALTRWPAVCADPR